MSHFHDSAISAITLALAITMSPLGSSAQRIQSAAFAPPSSLSNSSAAGTLLPPRIWKHPSKNRRTHALKGATIGLVIGAVTVASAMYVSSDGCFDSDDPCFTLIWTALGAGAGAVLGAGTGAVIGAATWKPPNTTPK